MKKLMQYIHNVYTQINELIYDQVKDIENEFTKKLTRIVLHVITYAMFPYVLSVGIFILPKYKHTKPTS